MIRRFPFLVFAFLSLGASLATFAEIPPVPEETLRAEADLVVVGRVTEVQAKLWRSTEDGFRETRHRMTLVAEKVEKGEFDDLSKPVIAAGSSYVLAPGNSGSAGIRSGNTADYLDDVQAGWKLRLYLKASDDGSYEILSPNGFWKLERPEASNSR